MMTYCTSTTVPAGQRPKRHLDDDDIEHFFKKRLLDNFENLKIFEGSKSAEVSDNERDDFPISTNNGASANTVVIDSIDEFLDANQDQSDLNLDHSKPIKSIDETNTVKEIVIPGVFLKSINELFNKEEQNKNDKFLHYKKKELVNRIRSRKLALRLKEMQNVDPAELELDLMLDEGEVLKEEELPISNSEIYYETYLAEFWSLIKYYNPKWLVFQSVQRYLMDLKNKTRSKMESHHANTIYKSDQIQELDDDGEDMVMENDSEDTANYLDTSNGDSSIRFEHYMTSTPSPSKVKNHYGDYYGESSLISDEDAIDEDEYIEMDTTFLTNNNSGVDTSSTRQMPIRQGMNVMNEYGSFYQLTNDAEPYTMTGSRTDTSNNINESNDNEDMELD